MKFIEEQAIRESKQCITRKIITKARDTLLG